MTPLRRRMTEDMQVRSFSRAPALQTERHHDAKVQGRKCPFGRRQAGFSKLPGLLSVARHSGFRCLLASDSARRTPAASKSLQ
jgi:hypothetical protein